ncbi:MAG: sensor histidine kinase, partial [Clostridia bacterium]|nr:sensor histidine kinase [Clostridia bacterium]
LENAVNSLIQKMRESYNQQARFVSDASHELRTPIAVIQGYANMLDHWGKTDEKVLEEGIAAIKTEADGMKNLVEQLLFLARGDSGRQKFNLTTFSLSELIREIHEEYNMIDSNHEWFLEMSEDDIVISGDESLIKQAVRIITDNAVKYTPQGGSITLRCRLNSIGEPSIQVQDSGIGIDQKDIPRMFDRFFRADPARTRNTGGTGLGLSIAKQIVDKHYGYFEVVSRMGIGTRMTINLPQGVFAQPQDKQG